MANMAKRAELKAAVEAAEKAKAEAREGFIAEYEAKMNDVLALEKEFKATYGESLGKLYAIKNAKPKQPWTEIELQSFIDQVQAGATKIIIEGRKGSTIKSLQKKYTTAADKSIPALMRMIND